MSRQVNLNDPDSWTDDDREYLRERGYDHPSLKVDAAPVFAPAAEAQSTEVQRLKDFLETHFPKELGVEGETPVATAIRLLGNAEGYEDDAPADEYPEWKVKELREEASTRSGFSGDPEKMNKPQLIEALRAWDAEHPDQLEA